MPDSLKDSDHLFFKRQTSIYRSLLNNQGSLLPSSYLSKKNRDPFSEKHLKVVKIVKSWVFYKIQNKPCQSKIKIIFSYEGHDALFFKNGI